jgi:hypothetical protein
LAARWRKGDEHDRHELLSALFEKIHVKDGQIIGCTPRGDRVGRVRTLLSTAWDYLLTDQEIEVREEAINTGNSPGDGPGAALSNVERRARDCPRPTLRATC